MHQDRDQAADQQGFEPCRAVDATDNTKDAQRILVAAQARAEQLLADQECAKLQAHTRALLIDQVLPEQAPRYKLSIHKNRWGAYIPPVGEVVQAKMQELARLMILEGESDILFIDEINRGDAVVLFGSQGAPNPRGWDLPAGWKGPR